MLVNDRLVALRLRKCATAYLVTTLQAVVGGELRKSLELGRDSPTSHGRIDFPLDGRRVVATVRNPWSWYTSLWAYGCGGQGGLYARATQTRSARSTVGAMVRETRETHALPRRSIAQHFSLPARSAGWTELYADPQDVDAFREWLRRVLDPKWARLVEPWYGATGMPQVAGLLTWRYLALFSRDTAPLLAPRGFDSMERLRVFDEEQNVCTDIIRADRIAAELPGVLTRAGYELDDRRRAVLTEHTTASARRNTSNHRPWREYYDADAAELVRVRERLVVERFDFDPPECR